LATCFFVSDLHGSLPRYGKLFQIIAAERPQVMFIGGDLLPSGLRAHFAPDTAHQDFINGYLVQQFSQLRHKIGDCYPRIFIIFGNDDCRSDEATALEADARGVWEYIHDRRVQFDNFQIYGYSYVPPTPFRLKDWERYDVSRYVDPGCISPEEGARSIPVTEHEIEYATIKGDLDRLTAQDDLENAIFLFHSPPHKTNLDRAALDGKMIDHVPLDPHVGSIAIRRFIESRQPCITLHGHIHESARLTGSWQDRLGRTYAFSAAHDGPELALIRFELENPAGATRELI